MSRSNVGGLIMKAVVIGIGPLVAKSEPYRGLLTLEPIKLTAYHHRGEVCSQAPYRGVREPSTSRCQALRIYRKPTDG